MKIEEIKESFEDSACDSMLNHVRYSDQRSEYVPISAEFGYIATHANELFDKFAEGYQQAVKDMEPALAMVDELSKELYLAIDEINDQRMSKVTNQTESHPDLWDQETLHRAQLILRDFDHE
jgi:hypothetical protein